MAEFSNRLKHEIDVLAQVALDEGINIENFESVCETLKSSYHKKLVEQTKEDDFDEKAKVYIDQALEEYNSLSMINKFVKSDKDICFAVLSYSKKTGPYDAASIKDYLVLKKLILVSHFYEAQSALSKLVVTYYYRKYDSYINCKSWREIRKYLPKIITAIQQNK